MFLEVLVTSNDFPSSLVKVAARQLSVRAREQTSAPHQPSGFLEMDENNGFRSREFHFWTLSLLVVFSPFSNGLRRHIGFRAEADHVLRIASL